MINKNYITRRESQIWDQIKDKEIVEAELVRLIFPELSGHQINKILSALCSKTRLARAKKGLYYNPLLLRTPHLLALRIHEGYLGLGSALREYGLLDYEDFTIFVMTKSFRKHIALKGTKYDVRFVPMRNLFCGYVKIDDMYVSSFEKTLFDIFVKPGSVGYPNLTKAMYDSKPDWQALIGFFKLTDHHAVYQRAGYILELMKDEVSLKVPGFVFEFLRKKVKNPVRLTAIPGKSIFNKRWKVQDNLGIKNIISWRQ